MPTDIPAGAVVALAADYVLSPELVRRLRMSGVASVALETDEDWRAALSQMRPGAALIVADSGEGRGIVRIRESRQRAPSVPVVAVGENPSVELVVALLRLGVADFVARSEGPEAIAASVQRALERTVSGESRASDATVSGGGHSAPTVSGGFSVSRPDAGTTPGGFHVSMPGSPPGGFSASRPDSDGGRTERPTPAGGPKPLSAHAQSVLAQLAGRHTNAILSKGQVERPGAGAGAGPGRAARPLAVQGGNVPDGLPPLDPKLGELQELMARADCPVEDVERFVVRDPALVVAVLKVANSAYFRSPRMITNIREACVRLGNRQVFALLLESLLRRTFSAPVPAARAVFDEMWKNAALTARLARRLAEWQRFARPEDVYVAALLHNIGEFVMVWRVVEEGEHGLSDRLAAAAPHLAAEHEAIGAAAAQKWALPPLVQFVAGHHHRPRAGETPGDAAMRGAIIACWALSRSVTGDYLPGLPEADPIALCDAIQMPESIRARLAEECVAALDGL